MNLPWIQNEIRTNRQCQHYSSSGNALHFVTPHYLDLRRRDRQNRTRILWLPTRKRRLIGRNREHRRGKSRESNEEIVLNSNLCWDDFEVENAELLKEIRNRWIMSHSFFCNWSTSSQTYSILFFTFSNSPHLRCSLLIININTINNSLSHVTQTITLLSFLICKGCCISSDFINLSNKFIINFKKN